MTAREYEVTRNYEDGSEQYCRFVWTDDELMEGIDRIRNSPGVTSFMIVHVILK